MTLVLFFYHVGPWDQTQVITLSGSRLHRQSRIACLVAVIYIYFKFQLKMETIEIFLFHETLNYDRE